MPFSRPTIAALLLAPVLLAAGSAASAAELTVTDFTDDAGSPAPGSFRAVAAAAQAGDVIRFASPLVIPLAGPIELRTAGLVVEGNAGFSFGVGAPTPGLATFLVSGAGVTLRNLSFRNVIVSAKARRKGARLAGFTMDRCTMLDSGAVGLDRVDGALLDQCTLTVQNEGTSAAGPAIRDLSGKGTRIEGGKVTNGSLRCVEMILVSDVALLGTEFGGAVYIMAGAEFAGPGRKYPSGAVTVDGLVMPQADLRVLSKGTQRGPTIVRNVTGRRIYVSGAAAEITDNELTGPIVSSPQGGEKLGGTLLQFTNNHLRGRCVVARNKTTGGWVGQQISCSRHVSVLVAEDNLAEDAGSMGISVASDAVSTVRRNKAVRCGTYGTQLGLGIFNFSPSRPLVAEDVVAEHCPGTGIKIGSETGGTVVVKNGQASHSEYGIKIEHGERGRIEGGVFEDCATGNRVGHGSVADVTGATVRRNVVAGIFVEDGGTARISRITSSENQGPGIDLQPAGVTPNSGRKVANRDLDWPDKLSFDPATRSVKGRAFPGSKVEVYRVEEGDRQGNPKNGEGFEFLASGTARGDGKFSIRVDCGTGDKLTLTATRGGPRPVTSEFSPDVECPGPPIELVSQSTSGANGSDTSRADFELTSARCIGGDGRWIVFTSKAPNLVDGETNSGLNVYLRDTQAGTTVRVNRTHDGSAFVNSAGVNNRFGYEPSISEDGRYIAYSTGSPDVFADDEDDYPTVALFDTVLGTTVPVTDPTLHLTPALPSGRETHIGGTQPAISGDGSVVAFVSHDRDWVAGDLEFDHDVFVWTRATGAMERVSVPSGGGDVEGAAMLPRVSHDGRFVVFSSSQELVPGNKAPTGLMTFLRDRQAGTTELVSVNEAGAAQAGGEAVVSDDGRYVAFLTTAKILAADLDTKDDVYVRDRQSGTTKRVSLRADGNPFDTGTHAPTISGDGRFVAFTTRGEYVIPDGPTIGNVHEVHLADLVAGTIVEASIGPAGEAFGYAFIPWLSRNGRSLVFTSDAGNLVTGVAPFVYQVYVRRLPAPQ